jgi:hypothetical protein
VTWGDAAALGLAILFTVMALLVLIDLAHGAWIARRKVRRERRR